MKVKNVAVVTLALTGTMMMTGCASIQAGIDRETACGNGPKAEEAVSRLTDEVTLKKVITTGGSDKARIAAIKKSNDVKTFVQLTCSGDESIDVRSAAFQRLVELGVVDNYISRDPNFAAIVLTGGGYNKGASRHKGTSRHKDSSRQRGGADSGVSLFGQAMQFPAEYRLKAIATVKNAGGPVSKNLTAVALDDSAPIEVRTAAIQNVRLNQTEFKDLMRRAGNNTNPARVTNEQLIKAYLATGDLKNKSVKEVICDGSYPLSSRKLAFSSIEIKCKEDQTFIRFLISEIIGSDVLEHELENKPNSDVVQFAKYVIAKAPQEALAESLHIDTYAWKKSPFLDEALGKITNEDLLVEIAQSSSRRIALGAARRIKSPDPTKRLIADVEEAKHNPHATERAAAICRVYAASPNEAYHIACHYIAEDVNDTIIAISDKKVVVGLLELSRDKNRNMPSDDKVRQQLMKAVYTIYKNYVDGLSRENAEELAARAQERAKSLARGGKTFVIGNYYARMPLADFIVLNKFQDVKATALLWEQKAQSEEFSVVSFTLDTKSLYKATGLAKSQLRFGLPRKLGIAEFDVETTEVKYERNYLAEAMDIYGAGKVTGGEIYFKSENQGKGVTLILWGKSGRLEISAI